MHAFKQSLMILALAALTGACGDDGSDTETDTATSAPTSAGPTTATPTSTDPGTTNPGTTNPTTGATDTGDTGEPGGAFVFDATPPEDMVQLDRMGMPAVATAVISPELKDLYNAGTPTEDVASAFVEDIVKNVTALHAALDDDLAGLLLTPCAAMDCVTRAAGLIVPDTLQINPGMPAGFPNGRNLADPVVDITLAVILLDPNKHPVDLFAKLPLNPAKNDREFLPDFPYVATPH